MVDDNLYLSFEPPLERPGDPIEEAALAFHRENPHVLQELETLCRRVRRMGRRRWGITAAFEVVRYNGAVTTSGKPYKLNNNYRPIYARWLMRDVPELRGFFETRTRGAQADEE